MSTLYMVQVHFMRASYFYQMIIRVVCFLSLTPVTTILRKEAGDNVNSLPESVIISIIFVTLLELTTYQTIKGQARLFLQAKVSEQEHRQMKELLDVVPDSVLIC